MFDYYLCLFVYNVGVMFKCEYAHILPFRSRHAEDHDIQNLSHHN